MKQDGFLPRPALYISLLLASFVTTFLVPYAANTTAFVNVSWISGILPFCFLFLPYAIPAGWGAVPSHPHDSQSTYTTLFRVISTLSAALHLKSTAAALFYNIPESTYYRHSLLHPFKEEHRTTLGRGSTAIGRVLAAMGEHPAVGSVAWDVLLTGLSLGIWAAIRGLDATEMLRSIMIYMSRARKSRQENSVDSNFGGIKTKLGSAASKNGVSLYQSRKGPGRPKKTETSKSTGTEERKQPSTARRARNEALEGAGPPKTSSDRQKHSKSASRRAHPAKGEDDDEYHPSDSERIDEGDEDNEADLEIAALAWGLLSVGGLGTGGSAVYGAEATSR
ncbi:hypothetical protein ONS96_000292 [Cadophora gregata f. sp. sojae]|nr:hypothetical protein ONS96_000292 [Cadophora gregata f. sp. sojae]